MAFLPAGFGTETAKVKPTEGFEILKDGKYVFLHKATIVQDTQAGQAIIIEHEILESEVLVEGVQPNAVGSSWGLFLPMYGKAAIMLKPNFKAYVLGLLGINKNAVDETKLAETIDAIGGSNQVARGMMIRGVTYHTTTKEGSDFLGVNWHPVAGENIIGAPSVLARRANLDAKAAGMTAAPTVAAPTIAAPALPSIPTAASALPIADGWLPHPSSPATHVYRGSEVKTRVELGL